MPVSDVLKQKRKKARLTQAELAEISGVSQQAISFIENGRNTPSEGTMRLLAKALDCTVAELIGDTENAADNAYSILSSTEQELLSDFRELNRQGKELILQTVRALVISGIYKKFADISNMEI